MIDPKEIELLRDIAKLINKYGLSVFEDLSKLLTKPDLTQKISTILSQIVKTVGASGTKSKIQEKNRNVKNNFRESLVDLQNYDTKKGELLLQLYDDLISRKVLKTIRELKSFAQDNGIKPIKSSSRDKAIVPFVKSLMVLDIIEIQDKINKINKISINNDRSLEGWSNIILKKPLNEDK